MPKYRVTVVDESGEDNSSMFHHAGCCGLPMRDVQVEAPDANMAKVEAERLTNQTAYGEPVLIE